MKLYKENRLTISEKTPTDILIINFIDSDYKTLSEKAEILRNNQVNVEIYHNNGKKIGEQIKYANKKGIRYILMVSKEQDEIKDLFLGEQKTININFFAPDRSNSTQSVIIPSLKKNILKYETN